MVLDDDFDMLIEFEEDMGITDGQGHLSSLLLGDVTNVLFVPRGYGYREAQRCGLTYGWWTVVLYSTIRDDRKSFVGRVSRAKRMARHGA